VNEDAEEAVDDETPVTLDRAAPADIAVGTLWVDTAVITRWERAGRLAVLRTLEVLEVLEVLELLGLLGVFGVVDSTAEATGATFDAGGSEDATDGAIPHVEQNPSSMTPSQFLRLHMIFVTWVMVG
jgi:hypothetical protein